MGPVRRWALGLVTAILGLFALFVASRAEHGGLYAGGLIVFAMCVIYIAILIKSTFDEAASHS
jgi:hypothetical protein